MTREQKVSTLIQYLKQENQGYASIPNPIDEGEQRRLLRSLMNVRYPGHASAGQGYARYPAVQAGEPAATIRDSCQPHPAGWRPCPVPARDRTSRYSSDCAAAFRSSLA